MRVYDGYLKVDKVNIRLGNGKEASREILKSRNAVGVLCKVIDKDEFLLVKQYRAPINKEIVEIVAGCVELGENPEECAEREVREEIGRQVLSIGLLGSFYPSAGYSSERIFLYLAVVGQESFAQELDGDEEVEIVKMTKEELSTSMFFDAKTIIAISAFMSI